jgi:hypothetical protein
MANRYIIDAKGIIRESIRRNRRKSKRKRSESFDYSLFLSQPRLDESDSESDEEYETSEDSFDHLQTRNETPPQHEQKPKNQRKKSDWSADIEEIKEDQDEYASSLNKSKNTDFGFGGGFKMQVMATPKPEEVVDQNSPEFKTGYKMQMK